MKYYFIYRDDEQQGPFLFEELKELHITKETMVWFEGLENWQSAGQSEELQTLFISKPPPISHFTAQAQTEKQETAEKNNLDKKSAEFNILGLKGSTFYILLTLIIAIIVLMYFNNLQIDNREKLIEKNQQTELYNKQQKIIEEQNKRIARQEQIERKRIEREKKLALEKKISELNNQLNLSYQNLENAKKHLIDVSEFKFLRSSSEKKQQVDAAQHNINFIQANIRNLETEMQKNKSQIK